MESPSAAELIAGLGDRADAVRGAVAQESSAAEVLRLARGLEVARRKVDAAALEVLERMRLTGAHAIDGHANPKVAVKHLGRLAGADALGRSRAAVAYGRLRLVREAFVAGRIPTGHLEILGRLYENPRVRDVFDEADRYFRDRAVELSHDEFRAHVALWESLADADGAEDRADRAHRRRAARIDVDPDGTHRLFANEGALRGVVLATILRAFEQAEFEADWAEARQRLGDAATKGDLARSAAQRRADAMFQIFRLAAANSQGQVFVPNVDLVIDEETFATELARQAASSDDERPSHDPSRVDEAVSQSLDGTPLTPAEIVLASFTGLVRRIVVDRSGNVINHGRAKRLFTGSSRHAVLLREALANRAGARCFWPGCDVSGLWAQIDHREPAARGGLTDHTNGAVACGTHNRLKETGFRPVFADDGTWTIHRPDDTPITRAA